MGREWGMLRGGGVGSGGVGEVGCVEGWGSGVC